MTNEIVEEWRELDNVIGIPGYRISSLGRLQSRWGRGNAKWLTDTWHDFKGHVGDAGHIKVDLRIGVRQRLRTSIHQLMMLAFCGPPAPGQEVRHRDGLPANNILSNLEYGTRRENIRDEINQGTYEFGENNHRAVFTREEILKMRLDYAAGKTQRIIAAEFGTSQAHVSAIVTGKRWGHIQEGICPKRRARRQPVGNSFWGY
jgi:hypothetical protein